MYIFFSFLFGIKLSLLCGYLPSPPISSAIPAPALPTWIPLPNLAGSQGGECSG